MKYMAIVYHTKIGGAQCRIHDDLYISITKEEEKNRQARLKHATETIVAQLIEDYPEQYERMKQRGIIKILLDGTTQTPTQTTTQIPSFTPTQTTTQVTTQATA